MAVNSDPNEGSRKSLDEIRRELDAEYGYVDAEPLASDVREARDDTEREDLVTDVPHARPTESRLFRPRPQAQARPQTPPRPQAPPRTLAWEDEDEISDERVEQLFERHQLAMGRRAADDERPRRSGYLLAALVGCVVGQALLLVFLLVTQHRLSADLLRTTLALSPRAGTPAAPPAAPATAAPPASAPATVEDSAPVKDESARPKEEVARPKEESVQSIVSVPPNAEPPAAPAGESATASAPAPPPPADLPPRAATKATSPASGSRRSDVSRPLVTQEPQGAPVRQRPTSDGDVADAQARLRYALNEWLRTSAHGRAPMQTTEPVIVLGPDGRTAKTYVSVASPIGMIPREQRWERGAGGWTLVDDRQSGLPRPGVTAREK